MTIPRHSRGIVAVCRKNPGGVIRGCSHLYSIRLWRHKVNCPAGTREAPLGVCAAENMKNQRTSYFAGFASRRHAATGKFQPFSRG